MQIAQKKTERLAEEQQRVEEALKDSEGKYRSLFDAMLNGFAHCKMVFDKHNKPIDWVYLDVNDALSRVTGLRKEAVLGKKVTEAIPGIAEDAPELFETYGRVASMGEEARFEIFLDTLQMWFSVVAYSPRRDEFVAILEDITERKRAEKALAEERRLGELLLDSLPQPAMLIHRDRTILAANKTAREAGAEVGGFCWQKFAATDYIPEQDKQYLCEHGAPPPGGTHCTFCLADESLDCRGPANNPRLYAYGGIWDTHWIPLDDDIFLHYAIDMSEHIQTESELRQSEMLRAEAEKLAAAGRMAARVAHEINNPLAGIKAAFHVVKKAIAEDYPRYKHVARIEKEIERIEQIVRQMIHLHRAEREAESDVSIRETVDDVVAMLQPLCRRHEVSIEVDTESCQGVVKLPENGLRQVLYALLVNGIEASPRGGVVRVGAVMDERTVQITVADEGAGVAEQLRDRVFEPFFTTKGTEVTGGLGLGLPIARGIVEAWGGTLDFDSQPNKGCVFRIVLPREEANESSDSDPPGANPDCG